MSDVAGPVRMVSVPVRRAVPSGSGGSGGGARRAVAPTGRIRVDSPASLRRFRDLPLFGGEADNGAFGRIVGRGLAHVEADAVPALADFEGNQEDLALGPELFASELKRVAPDRDFGRTGEIFDINDVELAAIASGAGLDTIHHATNGDDLTGKFGREIGQGVARHTGETSSGGTEWVLGDIDAEQLFFPCEHVFSAGGRWFQLERGQGGVHFAAEEVEHGGLATFAQVAFPLCERAQAVRVDDQCAAIVAHEVECPGPGEVLERAAVGSREVCAFAEVFDVAVGAIFFAYGDDAFDGRGADVLHDANAK